MRGHARHPAFEAEVDKGLSWTAFIRLLHLIPIDMAKRANYMLKKSFLLLQMNGCFPPSSLAGSHPDLGHGGPLMKCPECTQVKGHPFV